MSTLSDTDIRHEVQSGQLGIEPFDNDQLQPASYDVLCGNVFLVPPANYPHTLDPYHDNVTALAQMTIPPGNTFILPSLSFCLATTVERVHIGRHLVSRIEGKSSLARLGLFVHITAGFLDPGFVGNVTLEMYNGAPWAIVITPGMAIAQLSFSYLNHEASAYQGKYQGDSGPKPSRYHENARPEVEKPIYSHLAKALDTKPV